MHTDDTCIKIFKVIFPQSHSNSLVRKQNLSQNNFHFNFNFNVILITFFTYIPYNINDMSYKIKKKWIKDDKGNFIKSLFSFIYLLILWGMCKKTEDNNCNGK